MYSSKDEAILLGLLDTKNVNFFLTAVYAISQTIESELLTLLRFDGI